MSNNNKVRVGVRVRPQSGRELVDGSNVCVAVSRAERTVTVGRDKQFKFNYVFDPNTEQEELYGECVRDPRRDRDLLLGVFEGYNATVFAYGQTGSGKTYTMGTAFQTNEQTMGIIPRAARDLFDEIDERKYIAHEQRIQEPVFELQVQFIELYNEELVDLLADPRAVSQGKIEIRELGGDEVCVRGASTRAVHSEQDIQEVLRCGTQNRSTAATNMNEQSSRSHAIFTIMMRQTRVAEDDPNQWEELSAKFHFVDLAGSEGLRRTGATGDRAREGIHINKGLLDLGNVISALHERSQHIPYRNGKLTQLLKDSLGGNSRTLMIACVSPNEQDMSETVKTLNYASRASTIKNQQSRHMRLIANPGAAGAADDANSESSGSTIPIPALPDDFPYARAQWFAWHAELGNHLPAEPPQMDADFIGMEEEALLQLDGPDDLDGIARVRQLITQQISRHQDFDASVEANSKLLDQKLKQRLCVADLDRTRVAALEDELRRVKCELGTRTRENRSLKRNYMALESRLRAYECELENGRLQVERAKRYIDQERAPEKDARRTLHKLAELFESPVPTTANVARLRKKFDEAGEGEELDEEEGPSQPKTPKLMANSTAATAKSTVQFRDMTNSQQQQCTTLTRAYLGGHGYVNPKYAPTPLSSSRRRSRSVGAAPRVLNHQPQHKIPMGTVFQPKLPRNTKHTTQLDANELKKHDEYLVTRQEVDQRGNVQTKLFKGNVAPTAGGGSAVIYRDVENLTQESPAHDGH